ncbi:hypothetical protein SERLA73DRAFT_178879 [Serpula lacrymans var. lacrymans S7.3]|uniref:Uncharacterized protein n=2 Tax=Serpula lacrymans var. lacrymans TaxID=341189 RepID=F8PT68_SERL3|nr:uncharacterized protein SERLADRAFT_463663 [Serpula lacrymans var. lacrymans S7.9]EGO00898.1 hypothetical protein SERLA73DRAFT_178879 [Serpula lacrymans var. lacrymans S7.3]EGO26513.1 hypothetical protein SERLADRAFT_463663 [Serpula lacrymans var. lacrymans S7.9]
MVSRENLASRKGTFSSGIMERFQGIGITRKDSESVFVGSPLYQLQIPFIWLTLSRTNSDMLPTTSSRLHSFTIACAIHACREL